MLPRPQLCDDQDEQLPRHNRWPAANDVQCCSHADKITKGLSCVIFGAKADCATFISMDSISRNETPRFFMLAKNASKSANALPGPHRPCGAQCSML